VWFLFPYTRMSATCPQHLIPLGVSCFYSCCSHLEHRESVKCSLHFSFLILRQSVGLLGRRIRPSQGRYLIQTQNKRKQISMPRVGFEFTIPLFERAKIFHALDRAAIVIGLGLSILYLARLVKKDPSTWSVFFVSI
jgi:hypothetical protein